MNCEEARLMVGADPENTSTEVQAHLAKCPECEPYRQQMLDLNAKIRRALELNLEKLEKAGGSSPPGAAPAGVPPAMRSNVTPFRRRSAVPVEKHKHPRLLAFAASVAAAAVAALTLWLSKPSESLASEIVKHVEGEPNSWSKTEPVSSDQLRAVLRKSGVKLGDGMPSIVYASSCWFRGHYVPHFVVTTSDGPVTVMILVNEKVSAPQQFNEDGYSGLLVPAPTGSVAVLGRKAMPLEQPATNVVKALQATAQPKTGS